MRFVFFSFQSLTPGTAIDFTDNGYERANEDLWGDTEGTIRIVWNGSSALAAGTVICLQGSGNTNADFDVYTCGGLDTNWTISSLNGNLFSFNLISSDEFFIMQNGNWVNPSGSHNAFYTGNVLYGWTATGWGTGTGTSLSHLFPGLNCLNTDVSALSNNAKVKYNGPLTTSSRIEWIERINDSGYWQGFATNADYLSGGPNYGLATNCPLSINSSSVIAGMWNGSVSSNWFDCNNWEDKRVPFATVDVVIPSSATNAPRIDVDANFSDDFGDIAVCHHLAISGQRLYLEDAGDVLEVKGSLSISGTGSLDMDGSTSSDGTLLLEGDWMKLSRKPSFI